MVLPDPCGLQDASDYVWNGKQLTEVEHFEDLPECIRKRWEEENEITCENYRKLGIKPDFQTIIDRGRTFLEYSDRVMAGTDCPYAGVVPGLPWRMSWRVWWMHMA